MLFEIAKAIISTPTDSKTGRVDYDRVPSGASIWITVTNPQSPLHGRPILITKRPDGLFAITGGSGFAAQGRRHMVLTGKPKKTRRDEELEEAIEEAKQYNEPLLAASKELDRAAREEIRVAADGMLESLGLSRANKQQFLDLRDEVQNYVEDILDDGSKEEAKRLTDTVMRHVVQAERQISERVQRQREHNVVKVGKRLQRLREQNEFINEEEILSDLAEEPMPEFPVTLPDFSSIADLTPEEQELQIANYFDDRVEDFFDEDRIDYEPGESSPEVTLGTTVKPLEINSLDKLEDSVSKVRAYWEKRAQREEIKRGLKDIPLAQAVPSTLAGLEQVIGTASVNFSIDEIESKIMEEQERWIRQSSALALYDALGEYWNDDTSLYDKISDRDKADTVMKFHVDAGAATALAAVAKEHLGYSLDTMRLIKNGNLELAATAVALEIRNEFGDDAGKYQGIVEKVRNFNVKNQQETEQRALDRHGQLKQHWATIQQQKQEGDLLDRVRISSLESDSLIEQRRNLGNALGSLQASATFYDALERFRTARDDVVSIHVGGNPADAESVINNLKIRKNYAVDSSDPDNIKINLGMASLRGLVTRGKDVTAKRDQFEKIKTDMSGVVEDDAGNLIVENYDVPMWKNTFIDEGGTERDYKWRVEQRNDINWLMEATKPSSENPTGRGGGMITRVVGAGKTNTALGFFANKINEDPNYRALIAVPKGRAQQWHGELERFTNLKSVYIPDGTPKEQIDAALANSKPGTVYIMGHREASRSHDILEAIQTDPDSEGKFSGIVIDEPQEMIARGLSGNVGALGKRIMKLPVEHRVGLTATPARRNPLEAYDMVKWAAGSSRDIGSKASFRRTFSGFGSGTNAQDSAIRKAYFETIQPFVSGDRITTPNFKVEHSSESFGRSPEQISRQREIESQSGEYINDRRRAIIAEARRDSRHPLRRFANWETTLPRRATELARREVAERHQENIDNGSAATNSKMQALRGSLEQNRDKKHVIFVDSAVQRKTMVDMLQDMGYGSNEIKNIASTTTSISGQRMADRAKAFRTDPNVNIIMIDRSSASGYNLQSGDFLHVVGSPADAATYLQAQGRVARMPREGDVNIKTYRYADNPVEQAHWNDIETQLKVLRAAAPGMFPGE